MHLLPRCLQALADEGIPIKILIVDNSSRIPVDAPAAAECVTLPARSTVGSARNAGLSDVTTPFVIFADADDQVAPGSIARGLHLLNRRPHSPGILGRSIVEEDGSRRRGRTPRRAFRLAAGVAPALAPLFWLLAFQCSITSTLLRTSAVRDAGGFADADIGEDWVLAARLARRGRFVCHTQPVRIYHRHNAAARIAIQKHPSSSEIRRVVCRDCLDDPVATRIQKLVASATLRRL